MSSRRDFIKKAAVLGGGASLLSNLPPAIQKAFAINPATGTTFLDAEHVVILMQENRSFDHTYGTLQGVRGFNDPHAITLPSQNPVWLQTNKNGETFGPYRLDISNTKVTWIGGLPHSWKDQVDAFNKGRLNRWLDAKARHDEEHKTMPFTMGYYTRQDIPFYYALADAFTVCDQHFCSSLTGTTPNRLYLWSGTIREEQHENSPARVWNGETDYDVWGKWKTYPERLEENGISWKIYQNELSIDGGFEGEEDAWLSNFTDNPIEFFEQYNVKLSERYINWMAKAEVSLPKEIADLEEKLKTTTATGRELKDLQNTLEDKKNTLKRVKADKVTYTREKWEQLSRHAKTIHEKAFTTNKNDPDYHHLKEHKYMDDGVERVVNMPKGDVLHQFRQDVNSGQLPTVSWLVAPEAYSDHPGSAWYGSWYVSEVFDILTKNPEVWKKTVFILTYDENDGYFDHVTPFTAPNAHDAATGKSSASIDTSVDFVTWEQENKRTYMPKDHLTDGPIGLGYRVPMVVASPWSRGGWVNSQVFDHTSPLQFLEVFLKHKTGKDVTETNISQWRRAISGDLTSVFRPYNGEKITTPAPLGQDAVVEAIHKAKFKGMPGGYHQLTAQDIEQVKQSPENAPFAGIQEKGIRQSNALPYEMYVEGTLSSDKTHFDITFTAGKKSTAVPFNVYAYHKQTGDNDENVTVRTYAVAPGDTIKDSWPINSFDNGQYLIKVYAPNGFVRSFAGSAAGGDAGVAVTYQPATMHVNITVKGSDAAQAVITNNSYKAAAKQVPLKNGIASIDVSKSFGWYQFTVTLNNNPAFAKTYAGRMETGKPSYSDPLMGKV